MTTLIARNGRIENYGVVTIVGGPHDGKRADSLRWSVLFPEFQRMGVPGISAKMGKDDLLAARYQQLESIATEHGLRQTSRSRRPPPLDIIVAKQAAAFIASGQAGETPRPSTAPHNPIASTRTRD